MGVQFLRYSLKFVIYTTLSKIAYEASSIAVNPLFGDAAVQEYRDPIISAVILILLSFPILSAPALSACTPALFAPQIIQYLGVSLMRIGPVVGPVLWHALSAVPIAAMINNIATPSEAAPASTLSKYLAWVFILAIPREWIPLSQLPLSALQVLQFTGIVALFLDIPLSSLPSKPAANSRQKKQPTQTSLLKPLALMASAFMLPFLLPHHPPYKFRLLARQSSLTGQISVIEYEFEGGQTARAMRADHSLLGGIWISYGQQLFRDRLGTWSQDSGAWEVDDKSAARLSPSIYTTMYLQEIVRLAERPAISNDEKALIIGLGCGISAAALQSHGVVTSVVEIDPAVYHYAREYFGLSEPNGEVALVDARAYLKEHQSKVKYDYIIHDVFTGGSVPSLLFTTELWTAIKAVLKIDGVVAINFGGQIHSDAGKSVLTTLLRSFKTCRAFQDQADDNDADAFRNMVVICSQLPTLNFRKAVPADYLESEMRGNVFDHFLEHEVDLQGVEKDEYIITDSTASKLDKWQKQGAIYHHFKIMNEVLPKATWVYQ